MFESAGCNIINSYRENHVLSHDYFSKEDKDNTFEQIVKLLDGHKKQSLESKEKKNSRKY